MKHSEVEIDGIDKKIINNLIDNARYSYRQLAGKVGVSVATVMNRVKRLEKAGVIAKYTIGVKYSFIGYDMQIIMDVRVSKGKLSEVEEKIAKHPNVFAVYDNTGPFDATIIAKFKDRRSADAFIKQVQKYDFVERTETKLLLKTVTEHMIKLPINPNNNGN
ncbi:Lrp/AsnC family transcriptional regulator [Candidatus Woesearchaeota archaeon]|nr:Lrp/AsnC family transcriptional regulator [Candidatus Woesearchaeota archaeon]